MTGATSSEHLARSRCLVAPVPVLGGGSRCRGVGVLGAGGGAFPGGQCFGCPVWGSRLRHRHWQGSSGRPPGSVLEHSPALRDPKFRGPCGLGPAPRCLGPALVSPAAAGDGGTALAEYHEAGTLGDVAHSGLSVPRSLEFS